MKTDASSPDATGIHARRSTMLARAAMMTGVGAWECDLATERLTWTDGVYALFDIPLGSPLRRAATVDLYLDESRRDMEAMRSDAIRTGRSFVMEAQIRTGRGDMRWMRLFAEVAMEDGRPVRLFGAKQDITSEREAWERLRQLAECDALTGLANRRAFEARYRRVVEDEGGHAGVRGLALIDLDDFKQVNDRLGHAAGDECLRQVAMRLRRIFNDAVLVARIGGDEFAVLLRAPLGPARIADMLHRASMLLCEPVLWNGALLDMGASIGATLLGTPHTRPLKNLLTEADTALYAAKAAGKNTVRLFGGDLLHSSHSASRRATAA